MIERESELRDDDRLLAEGIIMFYDFVFLYMHKWIIMYSNVQKILDVHASFYLNILGELFIFPKL